MLIAVSLVWFTFPQVEVVKAEDIIYVKADGRVEGTDMIQRSGDAYTFLGNVLMGIQIQRSNIVVNGAGYTLQGDGEVHGPDAIVGMGIEIVECNNVTIKNLNIIEFTRGIRFTNASDCEVYQNFLSNNCIGVELGGTDRSYSLVYANSNQVSGNIIKENDYVGVLLFYGASNTISQNIITSNDEGIYIGCSGNNIVWNNITDNNKGVYIEASGSVIHHNNFVNNTHDWWDYGLTPWPFQLPFSVSSWDDGTEGNYWSRYYEEDNNSDSIGDTAYLLYENNTDNYPLMEPVDISTIPEFSSWFLLIVGFFAVSLISVALQVRIKQGMKK